MPTILIVTNGWTGKEMGGGEYHIMRVLRDWNNKNQISVIMPRSGYRSSKGNLLSNEYPVYFSSPEDQVGGLTSEVIFYLRRILRSALFKFKQNPEIVISSSHMLYDVLPALILSIRRKSKLVIYVHHIIRSFRTYGNGIWTNISLLNEKIGIFLSKNADLVFVVNHDVKDYLIRKGFQADKIFVTSNGVEQEVIESIKVNTKEFDACFCGRLNSMKGVYDLIEVWGRVLKYFPQSKLVIIGHGPEYDNMLKVIRNKALNKSIILTGFISEKKKFSIIKSCKMFISASYEEGWGIAVTEAMACRLAVVCYNLSAYKVFGDAINIVELGNKEKMVQAIVELLVDENKLKALANKAKEFSELLNWYNVSTQELKQIYTLVNYKSDF